MHNVLFFTVLLTFTHEMRYQLKIGSQYTVAYATDEVNEISVWCLKPREDSEKSVDFFYLSFI